MNLGSVYAGIGKNGKMLGEAHKRRLLHQKAPEIKSPFDHTLATPSTFFRCNRRVLIRAKADFIDPEDHNEVFIPVWNTKPSSKTENGHGGGQKNTFYYSESLEGETKAAEPCYC